MLCFRVLECKDLATVNGECNPYATVTLFRGKSHSRDEVRSTATRKKNTSPRFEESFIFDVRLLSDLVLCCLLCVNING